MAVFYHRTSTAMKIRTDGNAFKAWRASIAIEAWDNFGLLLAIYFGDLCCCNFCQLLAQLCRPGEPALQWKLRGLAQLLKLWVIWNAWWDSSMEAGKTCNAMQLRNSNQNATNNWKEMGIQLECNWNAIESNSNQLECDLKAIGMLLGELAQLSKPRVLWRAFWNSLQFLVGVLAIYGAALKAWRNSTMSWECLQCIWDVEG